MMLSIAQFHETEECMSKLGNEAIRYIKQDKKIMVKSC